jgi:hypothetical protein
VVPCFAFAAAAVAVVLLFSVTPAAAITVDPALASTSAAQWSVAPASAQAPTGASRSATPSTTAPASTMPSRSRTSAPNPRTYVVAPSDGVVGDSRAFDVAAGDPQDSGAWITVGGLGCQHRHRSAGRDRVLPVRIDLPAGVTPGDHPAGVTVGVTGSSDGVTVTNRVGVRVHLQVAGDIAPALQIADVSTTFTPSWIPFAPGRSPHGDAGREQRQRAPRRARRGPRHRRRHRIAHRRSGPNCSRATRPPW